MGTIIFAYVVGAVMELVMNSDPAGYLFKQGMRTMRDYLLEFDILPSSLCSSARKQYAHHMKRRGVYADADMLRGAPTLIRNATLRFVHRNSLLGAPLLSAMEQAHPGFLALLEVFARVRALQRGEFVQVPGESCAEAWFVLRGRLQVWRGGQCERLLEAGDVGCGPALYLPAHIPGYARVAVVARDDAHIAAVPRGFVDALDRVAPSVCDRFLEAVEALDLCARISRKARGKLEARFTDAGAQQRPHVASAPSDTPGDDGARPTLTGGIAASRREVGVAVRAAGLVATHGALATRLYRLPTPDELPALVQDMARGKGPHAEGRRTRSARSILSRAAISLRWTASVAPEVAESPKVGGEGLNSQAAEAEADSLVAVPRYQRPLDRSYSASSLDVDGVEDGNVRQMLALIDDWIAVAHEDMPDLVAHLQSLADEANASEAAALKAAREGGLKLS